MLILRLNVISAEPLNCESDKDCLKGKAKCVRRECQCTDENAFGDGQDTCLSKYKICCTIISFLYSKKKLIYSVQRAKDSFHSAAIEVPVTSKFLF